MKIQDIVHILAKIFSYLDSNPQLIEEIFKEEKIKDSNKDVSPRKSEIIDIYKIYEDYGTEGLRKKLEECNIEELKEIVKLHRLDPKKYFYKWTTKKKFIECILDKIESKIDKGKAFITTQEDKNTH